MQPSVVVASSAQGVDRYVAQYAIVVVDVIRATTTAITAMQQGRRCLPAADVPHAVALAQRLENPLLIGELGGFMPIGFDLDNSPSMLASRRDVERPAVMVSSSGTRVLLAAARARATYLACLRNVTATVDAISKRHGHVALIGAATQAEFREEDQLCCARIAEGLLRAGYSAPAETFRLVERWQGAPPDAFVEISKSVPFLRRTGRTGDLDFVVRHIDDVPLAFRLAAGEVVSALVPTLAAL